MKKHVSIRVQGRVQGVWYRANAEQKARQEGIHGFVQNNPDGSVSIEAEGSPEALDTFLDWCRRGPLLARVDDVQVLEGPLVGYATFEQRR
ncbi:acylphosphatase [Arundinibacter roseus]|uniref:acylphosphatase n=1 Tax=Arundinibacter roseus TaxID=2070510 RepID=A0A4R4KIH5_9BACT|nr:acylphosphatase [Arundinibacter roseus]TDB67984.1 acylphosphatase [Arundinibacter roseus]